MPLIPVYLNPPEGSFKSPAWWMGIAGDREVAGFRSPLFFLGISALAVPSGEDFFDYKIFKHRAMLLREDEEILTILTAFLRSK